MAEDTMTDTKPAREPLAPCPWCGTEPNVSERTLHGGPCWSVLCRSHDCEIAPAADFFETEAEAIAAWNRRITRPPAPAEVAEAVKWANDDLSIGQTVRSDHYNHIQRLAAAAAERAPTEAQVREIAEALNATGVWDSLDGRTEISKDGRLVRALRTAGIIGGDHD